MFTHQEHVDVKYTFHVYVLLTALSRVILRAADFLVYKLRWPFQVSRLLTQTKTGAFALLFLPAVGVVL